MTLRNIDFKSGIIAYDDFNINPFVEYGKQIEQLSNDLLLVKYSEEYLIDVCWLPDCNPNGRFVVRLIKNEDWEKPIFRKETRNFERLEMKLQSCIDIVEELNKNNQGLTQSQSLHHASISYSHFSFDRSGFKAFFDEEQVYDMESGSLYYSVLLRNDFEFAINILAIDNFVSLTLRNNLTADRLLNIGFEGITQVELEKDEESCFLHLYKKQEESHNKPYLKVLIKPYFSIEVLVKE